MESGVFLKIKGRTKGFRAPWQQDLCMSPHFSSLSLCLAFLCRQVLLTAIDSHPPCSATPLTRESMPEKSSGWPAWAAHFLLGSLL